MADIFTYYPSSSRITFFPAALEDIRWVFEQFPQVWQSLPGVPWFRGATQHPVFHKILDRPTSPQEWADILLPQNFDARFLFVDVGLDGWTAVISTHADFFFEQSWMAHGLLVKILERGGYKELANLPEFSSISLSYDFAPVMLTSPVHRRADRLQVEVTSTNTQFPWSQNSTYDTHVPRFIYDCWAEGRKPYQGLDLPPVERIGEEADESLPSHLRPHPGKFQAFGFRPERLYEHWDKETGRDDYLTVLPFDATGHDRVADFFSTAIVAQWLRDTHGIRWDDPSFYQGDSLLYTIGGPGDIPNPFVPRIPVDTYHRFQGIDMERNRDLVARGQF